MQNLSELSDVDLLTFYKRSNKEYDNKPLSCAEKEKIISSFIEWGNRSKDLEEEILKRMANNKGSDKCTCT